MEDMLLREIEKTGKVLEAILLKLGVTTREKGEEAYDTARTGLREGLGMDFDAVLGSDDIAGALTAGYGFGDDNLERFARILFLLGTGRRHPPPNRLGRRSPLPIPRRPQLLLLLRPVLHPQGARKVSLTPRISRCSSSHIWLSGPRRAVPVHSPGRSRARPPCGPPTLSYRAACSVSADGSLPPANRTPRAAPPP